MSQFLEKLVISGISGKFPESGNMKEFRENLFNKVDMVTGDNRRWCEELYGPPARSGKLVELDKFDMRFFGIHPKQANCMDPGLRILLELTYEAIVDSGINPQSLRGSKTGVFIGVSSSDSEEYWTNTDPELTNGYGIMGCTKTMFANRISYAFDFKGPSFAIDTYCSSSLLAVEKAVAAIRAGDCESAIVGGVNILLKPRATLHLRKLNMLSPDGKCKSFDVSGDGYVRSESAVVIFIQKEPLAKRIYAKILHAKTNTDGWKENGVTFPSGKMQQVLLEETYAQAGIDPSHVSYVEAHGTGTKAGDPQELNSIANVFCKNRDIGKPLLIGSLKSNMGHSEPVSGLCSIAKIIISIQEGKIPANLHYKVPNPDIPTLTDGRLKVISEHEPWEGDLVGLNSFGFGGTNVHVILEANRAPSLEKMANEIMEPPLLVTFSGSTQESVESSLKDLNSMPRNRDLIALLHNISEKNIPGHIFKGFSVSLNENQMDVNVEKMTIFEKPNIWYIFSGMGSQWAGMGKDLFVFKIFRDSINNSAKILSPLGIDLVAILKSENEETFSNVMNSFVSITSIQIALVDLMASIGIFPSGIIGHSVGELACAYADGCFTAEQTILAAFARGKAILESNSKGGSMAAIGLSWSEAKLKCPEDIYPACHNSRDSVTVSGPKNSIEKFIQILNSEGIFAKEVDSSGYAFHSKYIAGAGDNLKKNLEKIIPDPKPRCIWISSSIPESCWNTPLAKMSSAEYHVNNLLSPVLFREAISFIPENAVVIEIAPHCLLQSILKRSLPSSSKIFGLMSRNSRDNSVQFLQTIGKLFQAGLNPKISNLYPKVDFPVSIKTPMINSLIKWDHSVKLDVADFGKPIGKSGEMEIDISLLNELNSYLSGHLIRRKIIYPATGYLYLVWKTFARLHGTNFENLPIVFENVIFERATILQKEGAVKFTINILEGTGQFEVIEGDSVAVSGFIRKMSEKGEILNLTNLEEIPKNKEENYRVLNNSDIYKELRLRGYDYEGLFKGIKSADNCGQWGYLSWTGNWVSFLDTMLQFGILSQPNRGLYLPTRLEKFSINPKEFKDFISENENSILSEGYPVFNYKHTNIIKCHGVEIKGLKASLAPKKPINFNSNSREKLEKYIFTPYFDLNESSLKGEDALRICVDLALENISSSKIKVGEILENFENTEESMINQIQEIISCHPLAFSELNIITPTNNFEQNGIKIIPTKNFENLAGFNLIIANDVKFMTKIGPNLHKNCFVILKSKISNFEDYEKFFNLTARKISESETYFLFKTKNKRTKNVSTIEIDNYDFSWLEKLQTLMNSETENTIYLVGTSTDSGIIGLVNCLRKEPGGENIRCILNQNKKFKALNFEKPDKFLQEILNSDLVMNVIDQNGVWGSFRHLPIDIELNKPVGNGYINALTRGDFSSLKWIQAPQYNYENQKMKELYTIYYAPVNFKDIMLASGKLPPDALPGDLALQDCVLGTEFAGKDSKGERVMGIIPSKGLATHVLADPSFTWKVPKFWTLEEAGTIPICYGTAYYALIVRGRMQPGESILIHSGSGGVGQAAISIALSMNCKVFITVGSTDKREYLKNRFSNLNENNFANSRDTSFEKHVLDQTRGEGVDLVLNSLSEEKLQASLRCLKIHGRFLEIGKYDLSKNTALGMSIFLKNVSFHGILVDALFDYGFERDQVVKLVYQGIESGVVVPLERKVFESHQIEEAFRSMTSGKQIGKVLVKIRDENENDPENFKIPAIPKMYFSPEKVYIIVGGLGGFGLELCNWQIERGANKIILVSRSGIKSGYQDLCIRRWAQDGAVVKISNHDVATLSGVESLIKSSGKIGPIGGIFNLAMVLNDGLFENQTKESFNAVTNPKIAATKYLDVVSRNNCPELEHFVVFSSVSCGRGNAGQTNYGFANSAMEMICKERKFAGLPGLAIQWGAIGDVGVILDKMGGNNDAVIGGTLPQRISSCFQVLDVLMNQEEPVVASMVLAEKSTNSQKSKKFKDFSLVESIANNLGIKDIQNTNIKASLGEMGLDSLMGVELKQTLEREFELVLSMQEIRLLNFEKLNEIQNLLNI